MKLAVRLKEARKEKGYSQIYVSDKLHVSRQAISNWENGRSYPDVGNLKALSVLYEISLDELFKETS